MQKQLDFNQIVIPSDILGISIFRSQLLKGIPANKKKKKRWLEAWKQLKKSETMYMEKQLDTSRHKQIVQIQERLQQPWTGQCRPSEILAWRDYCYRDIPVVSDKIDN